MRSPENSRKLVLAKGFDEVFELVKKAVEQTLGIHRAGLTLVLGDIPNQIGAFHELGSNAIVMNRNLLKIVMKSTRSKMMRNSYVFMILLHEYLHSLGYTSDAEVRAVSRRISENFFGSRHITSEMAVRPLDQFFPDLQRYLSFRDKREFETVRRFDSSSTPYIA